MNVDVSTLSQPLPPELAQGEFGTGWYYERFAAFSAAWAWRRSALFGVFAVPFGAMLGVVHGLYAHSWGEGLAVGWRAAIAALAWIACGPLLAAAVRGAGWGLRAERLGVLAAVIAGILLSWALQVYAETFHNHLMSAQVTSLERWIDVFSGQWPLHAVVENLTALTASLTVHAIGGGALALRSYFNEPARRQAYRLRQDLQALQQQKLAAEARLAVLQAQVEPHFLFNTLAGVSAEIQSDPERARRMLALLAQYLRATLPRLRVTGGVLSTLAEQFELCRRYLELMTLRLERLSVQIDLPAPLAPLRFPPLLLLSLVENAVTHGVEPRAAPTQLSLTARTVGAAAAAVLEVQVQDDGMGLREGLVEGTGITNIRAQLATLYGAAARFTLESPASGGVRAVIAIAQEAL